MSDERPPRFESIEEADAWAAAHREGAVPLPGVVWHENHDGEPPHAVPTWDAARREWNHYECGNCGEHIEIYATDDAGMQHYIHHFGSANCDDSTPPDEISTRTSQCGNCGSVYDAADNVDDLCTECRTWPKATLRDHDVTGQCWCGLYH